LSREYHYLIASLPDLLSPEENTEHPFPEFLDFCREQMTPSDIDLLNCCFILNDIKNVCRYAAKEADYITPSYYSQEFFDEALMDKDLFLPFISDFLFDLDAGTRVYPDVSPENELLIRLFENIESHFDSFIRDYLYFELHCRNICTALSHRALGLDYGGKIISADFISERIEQSNAPDFGLGGEIGLFEPILDQFGKTDPIEIEKTIEQIRWHWLDEAVGHRMFTRDAVISYAIKLQSVERWLKLLPVEGKRMLDVLIQQAREKSSTISNENSEV
jgi:hypothetical protein